MSDGMPDCEAAPSTPFPTLSPREREVALLLARGATNRAIAKDLDISIKTVDTHRQKVMNKLELDNNVMLCRLAIREGWIKP
jgi:DNA-binding NarL/FixJ family response regulator